MRQATRHFMAEAAFFAVLFCVLFWVMPVQSHAADTAGKVTGFIGETYYKNGKVQKKKAVFDNGSWYVTDKSGNKVRGTTYKIRGKAIAFVMTAVHISAHGCSAISSTTITPMEG